MSGPDYKEKNSGVTLKDLQNSLSNELVYKGVVAFLSLATIVGMGWVTDQIVKAHETIATPADLIKPPVYGPSLAEIKPDRYPHELYGSGQISTSKFRLNYNSPIGWEPSPLSSTDLVSGYLLNLSKGDASLTLIQNFLDAPIKTFSQYEDMVAGFLGFKEKPEGAVMLNRPGYKLKFISGGAYVMIKMVEIDNHEQPEVWQAQYTRKPDSQSPYSPNSYDPNQLLREAEEIMDSFRFAQK